MAKGDVLVRMKADVSNYDANIAKARKQLENFKRDNLSLSGALKQTQSALLSTAARFASVTAAVGALGSAFADNIATARNFEKSMSQLSSLTGMVGSDLEKLKEYAIELGSSTTLSASEVADAFKMIGSQQPQLLESGEALKAVTKNAITLAEAAGIDLATASQTLSTSINQMGGDSSNAERYINVLAAASQKGAGDIAWLGEAITKSGTTAKAVGTDYEELVANLEQLAKAGFDASTAGTALRSIIMNLENQANNDFKPSIVGLTQAFENLGKANLSIVGYQEIAGKMFASQAKALADAAGEAKNMTAAITGTNTAEEQAKTNTDNLDGSLKSLASAWEGLNLHINSSNGFLRDCVDWLKDVVTWADKAFTEAGKLKGVLSGLNGEEGSGNTKVDQQLKKLKVIKAGGGSDYIFNATLGGMVEDYNRQIMAIDAQIKNGGKPVGGGSGSSQDVRYLQRKMDALKIMRDQLQSGAKELLNPAQVVSSVVGGSGKGNNKTVKEEKDDFEEIIGLIPNAEEAVKSLQQQISESWDEGEISDLTEKLKVAEKELQRLKDIGKPKELAQGLSGFSQQTMSAWMQGRQGDLSKAEYGSAAYQDITANIADMETIKTIMEERVKAGLAAVDTDGIMESLWERVFDGENIPNDVWQNMVDTINDKLKEMNLEPIKINFDTGGLQESNKVAGETTKKFSSAAGAIRSVGSAMQSIEDPTTKVAGMIAEAIASIALGFSQAIGKDIGEKGNVWYGIATAAAGIASMVSTISSVKSASRYAEGGIVKGNSYSGDNIPILANAGEVILNRAQQGALASQLQDVGLQNIKLEAYVTGEQIRLVSRNTGRRTNNGETLSFKNG